MGMGDKPVITYKRKQRTDEWTTISIPEVKETSHPAPKPALKKAAPKAGQASILSFVGKNEIDMLDFDKSTKKQPAAASSSAEAKQMFLDFGQRNLGSQVCSECALTYSPGVAEDEALHAKFHREHAQATQFPGWKNETVVNSVIAEGSRIIKVTAEQSQGLHKKKIADLHAFVNRELSYSELTKDTESAADKRVTYLYVQNKKPKVDLEVVGCVIAEPILRAFPIILRRTNDSQADEVAGSPKKARASQLAASSASGRPDSPLRCSIKSQTAKLGISRIWVAKSHRRKGIGTRLIDAARRSMFYGAHVEPKHVAFSQPTSDGRALATRCLGVEFLVY